MVRELARLVEDVLAHRADGRVALARAGVEAAVRLVEQHGAREGHGLVDGEGERAVGHRDRLAQRVGGERAPRGGLPVIGRLLVPAAEVEVLRHGRRVLAHRRRATAPRRRGAVLPQLLARGGVGHVAHQRVLEEVLPRPGEARARVLDQRARPRPACAAPDSASATPSATSPASHTLIPKTLARTTASRVASSSASRLTWIAASIVGAVPMSLPEATTRASSSAKSGEPAACWAT